jgi:glycosyltransferase involved in cell wall biosynthesis
VGGYLEGVRRIKETYGVVPMVLLHDVLPMESELKTEEHAVHQLCERVFRCFRRLLDEFGFQRAGDLAVHASVGGVSKPITKIRFGSNVESNPVEEGFSEGLRRGEYLLCVGRIDVSKNQALLLEAWLDLVARGASPERSWSLSAP